MNLELTLGSTSDDGSVVRVFVCGVFWLLGVPNCGGFVVSASQKACDKISRAVVYVTVLGSDSDGVAWLFPLPLLFTFTFASVPTEKNNESPSDSHFGGFFRFFTLMPDDRFSYHVRDVSLPRLRDPPPPPLGLPLALEVDVDVDVDCDEPTFFGGFAVVLGDDGGWLFGTLGELKE